MTVRRVLALAAIVFSLSLSAVAQKAKHEDTNTRALQGVVTDGSDNPIVGAVVQLKDTKTLQIRSYITQKDGAYHFAGLSTNVDYEVKADFQGQSSGTKTLSIFDTRKQATINLKLK